MNTAYARVLKLFLSIIVLSGGTGVRGKTRVPLTPVTRGWRRAAHRHRGGPDRLEECAAGRDAVLYNPVAGSDL